MGPRRGLIAVILLLAAVVLVFVLIDRLGSYAPPRPAGASRTVDVDQMLGATLEPLDRETAADLGLAAGTHGLVVTSLSADGPAARGGVHTGDVIESIGSKPVRSIEDVGLAIGNRPGDLTLTLNRHRQYAIVHVSARSNPRGGVE